MAASKLVVAILALAAARLAAEEAVCAAGQPGCAPEADEVGMLQKSAGSRAQVAQHKHGANSSMDECRMSEANDIDANVICNRYCQEKHGAQGGQGAPGGGGADCWKCDCDGAKDGSTNPVVPGNDFFTTYTELKPNCCMTIDPDCHRDPCYCWKGYPIGTKCGR